MSENYSHVEVTLKNDTEGMFGSEPTDSINIPATIEAYETNVAEAIEKVYPGIKITQEFGSYAGRSIVVRGEDYEEEGEISDAIQEIVGQVYNLGTFWVPA